MYVDERSQTGLHRGERMELKALASSMDSLGLKREGF